MHIYKYVREFNLSPITAILLNYINNLFNNSLSAEEVIKQITELYNQIIKYGSEESIHFLDIEDDSEEVFPVAIYFNISKESFQKVLNKIADSEDLLDPEITLIKHILEYERYKYPNILLEICKEIKLQTL